MKKLQTGSIGAIQKNADKIRAIGLEIVTEYNRENINLAKNRN